jgi:hypothetical protein
MYKYTVKFEDGIIMTTDSLKDKVIQSRLELYQATVYHTKDLLEYLITNNITNLRVRKVKNDE